MFSIFPTPQAIAEHLSQILIARIQANPALILGLATGSTMEPIYAHFIQQVQQQAVDISQLRTFNLDEYIGLAPEHAQSYHYFMQQHLFQPIGLTQQQTTLPQGSADNLAQECANYSQAIAQQGIDFQLLGIGSNGHIGFNEPGTSFASTTHVVELSEKTRLDNGRFFAQNESVPTHAITMGLHDINSAKEIALVITGKHKADIVAKLKTCPVNENLPASILKNHPRVHYLIDEAAAAYL